MENLRERETLVLEALERGCNIRCIYCGYRIRKADPASLIVSSGEVIHTNCWEDYAAENADEFLKGINN